MSRAVLVVRHPTEATRTITTTAPAEAVLVALSRGAHVVTVVALCDRDGCSHPPDHNGPCRLNFDEVQS